MQLKHLLFILIAVSCVTRVNGQTRFQKTFGGTGDETARSVIQTSDGGYLISGSTTSFGNGGKDVYVVKTDSMGVKQWSKTFGGSLDEEGNNALEDNGSYYIGGYTYSYGAGNRDGFLAKLDLTGNLLFFKTFGTAYDDYDWFKFHKTVDNCFIITYSYKWPNYFCYTLIKADINGNKIWERTFGGTQTNVSANALQLPDSGYLITGYTYAYGNGSHDLLLRRCDSLGNVVWNKTLGTSVNEGLAYASILQGNTNVFVAATVDNSLFGPRNMVFLKMDYLSGNILWAKEYGKAGKWFQPYTCVNTFDGGFAADMNDVSTSGGYDMEMMKSDSSGNLLWARKYGGSNDDIAYCVIATKDSGFALIGSTSSFGAGGTDMYFVKTDANGISGCNDVADTLQQGTYPYTPTSPTIPETFPTDLNNGYNLTSVARTDSTKNLCTITPSCSFSGPNLIHNGDFSKGNTGFTTAFIYTVLPTLPSPDHYFIYNDAYQININKWAAISPDSSDFMIVDGSQGTGTLVWSQQVNSIKPGVPFQFSMIVTELNIAHNFAQATLYINITDQGGNVLLNQNTGPIVPQNTYSPPKYVWYPFLYTFSALPTSTSVTIKITQGTGGYFGWDYGIDNISLKQCNSGTLISNFTPSDTTFCGEVAQCIDFFDHSSGNPTSWKWLFPGATPSTSALQNPTGICYGVAGTYPVTLIVSGPGGADTLTISPMVTFSSGPPVPTIIVKGGDTLVCTTSGISGYQWFRNNNPIGGAIDSFYVTNLSGTYYLQVSDSLGCSRISNGILITSVNDYSGIWDIKIYPNPAKDQFTIYGLQFATEGRIEIYNVLGEQVYSETFYAKEKTINCKLTAGVYLVRISDGNGEWKGKVVVE